MHSFVHSFTHFYCVVSIPLKAEPETRAWVLAVYLGGDLRIQKWRSEESESEKKPVKLHYWAVLQWAPGLNLQGTLDNYVAYLSELSFWRMGVWDTYLSTLILLSLRNTLRGSLTTPSDLPYHELSTKSGPHGSWEPGSCPPPLQLKSEKGSAHLACGTNSSTANSIHHSCIVTIPSCLVSSMD